jgi:hypothetical protein
LLGATGAIILPLGAHRCPRLVDSFRGKIALSRKNCTRCTSTIRTRERLAGYVTFDNPADSR